MSRFVWVLSSIVMVGAAACEAGSPATPTKTPKTKPPAEGHWVAATRPKSLSLLEAPAHVVAEEASVGEVTVMFAARIRAIHVAPGDHVKAGQGLIDVVMPELNRAAATVVGIRAQLEMVDVRLEALKKLETEKLVRGAELYELRSTRGRLVADRAQALAVMRSCGAGPNRASSILAAGRFTLRAPVDGIVTRIESSIGRYAAEGAALAKIVASKAVRVEAMLTQPLPEEAILDLVLTDGTTHRLRPIPLGTTVDPRSGQTKAWLAFEEPATVRAGLKGRLRARPQGGLVQIPSAAIVRRGEVTEVHVVEGDTPVAKPVQVASDSGTSALVAGDIEVGAMVVVDPVTSESTP